MRALTPTRIAIGLGAALVAVVLILLVTDNIGKDDVPEGDVAVVDGDPISKEDFDRSFQVAAQGQGLKEPPAPGDEQYDLIAQQALSDLLDQKWIEGEAADHGITASDREIDDALQQTIQENFKSQADFQKFIDESGFTPEDIDNRIRLQVLSQKIQAEVTDNADPVSDDDVKDFYDQNRSQFDQPEQRNIRVVLNKDKAQADKALAELQSDNSDTSWNKIAAQFSTDTNSKDKGGIRESVTPGLLPDPVDQAVFDASEGEVQGPVETPEGFYVFQVDSTTPPSSQSLDDVVDESSGATVGDQIRQNLEGQRQQETFSAFIDDYQSKWTAVTICADDVVIPRCDNFVAEAQPACTDEQLNSTGCPSAVAQRSPAAPGQSLLSGTPPAPQRPHPPGEAAAPTGLPGGAGGSIPITPGGGAPGAAPGGAPGGTAPQGAAPGQ